MQCPVDGAQLVITERQGVEIDYCPQCRGVWLDRGELDKIIDRTAFESGPAPELANPEPEPVAPPPPPVQEVSSERPRRDDWEEERREYRSRDADRYRDDRRRDRDDERRYDDEDRYRGKKDKYYRKKKKSRVADFLEDIFDF